MDDVTKYALGCKLFKESDLKKIRSTLQVGDHKIGPVLFKAEGLISVAKNTDKAPTCSIPLLETFALFLKRSGALREQNKAILVDCFKDILMESPQGQGALLAEFPELVLVVEEIKKDVIAKLPRTPVNGAVSGGLKLTEVKLPMALLEEVAKIA